MSQERIKNTHKAAFKRSTSENTYAVSPLGDVSQVTFTLYVLTTYIATSTYAVTSRGDISRVTFTLVTTVCINTVL